MKPSLYYDAHEGKGPLLLLVHGMLSSGAQWMLNLEALCRVCRPVVVELFGHGRSPSPDDPAYYSPDHYVAEFEAVREELGAERWFVCGQSLGAALTLRYSLVYPERVIGQVFTNSNSALADRAWADRVLPLMEAQSRRLEGGGREALDGHPLNPARGGRLPAVAREALVADYALHSIRGVANTGLYTVPQSSIRDRSAEIRVPTLLVVGERETGFADARRYAENSIPELEVLALNAGHGVNAEAADAFNEAVVAFIERYAG
jgi:2-succinyl-6-hydroxy-2,4-cyclohexadiene-1-carboxylate synthase